MEDLIVHQEALLSQTSDFERYLSTNIDWNQRLIGIKGARGTGKTTLLLQRIKLRLSKDVKALYVTLDDLYFLENTLLDLANSFTVLGGTHLFLDEVHKYPRWSRELKLLYDKHPSLFVVFTSSSMLEINKGESDLSRRVSIYHLKELSFREFIKIDEGVNLPIVTLEELLKNHRDIAQRVKYELHLPVAKFKKYLSHGAYPYFKESESSYSQKLLQTIQVILEVDINAVENIPFSESRKIKKILVAIAQSAPFTPNIKKLSERLGLSRTFLLNSIKLLTRADLVIELYKPGKGVGHLTKPEKLYLHNPNLVNILGKENAEIGTLRETFFISQLLELHSIHLSQKADFLVDETYTFEIGGKNKTKSQISGIPNAYVVKDDIEIGNLNVIPIHLFGLLY